MARSRKKKFFIYATAKSGRYKGERLLGVNHNYEGGANSLSIKDLVDFLNEEKIDLSAVVLPGNFITVAKQM